MVTAIAFSVSKPFRKPIYSNLPFLFSIITITLTNCFFVVLPNKNVDPESHTNGSNWLDNFFLLEPFSKDGQSYYYYRFYLFGGIVGNSIITIIYEKWFI